VRTSRRRVFVLRAAVGGFALVVLGLAEPASAGTACSFDQPSATATVTMGSDETATLVRNGNAIELDGSQCGTATVKNADTIAASGTGPSDVLVIDLSGGPFAPGKTDESGGGDPEIEFDVDLGSGTPAGSLEVVGSADADTIVLGANGINLNADEAVGDVDVTTTNTFTFKVDAGSGDDVVSGEGGAGTGGRFEFGVTILGRTGNDRLSGSAGTDTLDGGRGKDTVDYSAEGAIAVSGLPGGSVTTQDGADTLASIENVIGSPQDDIIIGSGVVNELRGGAGDDTIAGLEGADELYGGPGRDTVDFVATERGVIVDLKEGTATGEGADTLKGFEIVSGSNFGDVLNGSGGGDTLIGRGGNDVINGLDGADRASGGKGSDSIFGGKGPDELYGGPGNDLLDGGAGTNDRCRGNQGADSLVHCEL